MGQEDVQATIAAADRRAQVPDAGPGVEDQLRAVSGGDLNAGGVAPEAGSVGAGHGDRAADAPQADPHQLTPSGSSGSTQNTTIAPW